MAGGNGKQRKKAPTKKPKKKPAKKAKPRKVESEC